MSAADGEAVGVFGGDGMAEFSRRCWQTWHLIERNSLCSLNARRLGTVTAFGSESPRKARKAGGGMVGSLRRRSDLNAYD